MPVPAHVTPTLVNLIAVAATPVVLVTATSILLSGYTGKYTSISGQMRDLTTEFRHEQVTSIRRQTIQKQLHLFHRRITAMWAASICLSFALLSFLATVLSVIFVTRQERLNTIGAAFVVVGLGLMSLSVLLELYEIHLARLTVAGELADVLTGDR